MPHTFLPFAVVHAEFRPVKVNTTFVEHLMHTDTVLDAHDSDSLHVDRVVRVVRDVRLPTAGDVAPSRPRLILLHIVSPANTKFDTVPIVLFHKRKFGVVLVVMILLVILVKRDVPRACVPHYAGTRPLVIVHHLLQVEGDGLQSVDTVVQMLLGFLQLDLEVIFLFERLPTHISALGISLLALELFAPLASWVRPWDLTHGALQTFDLIFCPLKLVGSFFHLWMLLLQPIQDPSS
mmetsp:Transcript_13975/g.32552  ORF Transcript_13975/g.32552 Transcript_13975/m.32552 type:complete len:236 (-) Transcript_13975:547-1254(-)